MTDKNALYETLGELLYVIAMADGVIQKEEKEAIADIFRDHKWAMDIVWSFKVEELKNSNLEEVYDRAIKFCRAYGPAQEYSEFLEAMELIAQAAGGVDANEEKRLKLFAMDIKHRFELDMASQP
jgi:tellurite resistance protein